MGSSQTRDRTCVPCIGRRILNHCATREVPWVASLGHRVTGLAARTPDTYSGSPERASDAPEVTQPASGRAGACLPGVGEESLGWRESRLGFVFGRHTSNPESPSPDLLEPLDGCARPGAPGTLVPVVWMGVTNQLLPSPDQLLLLHPSPFPGQADATGWLKEYRLWTHTDLGLDSSSPLSSCVTLVLMGLLRG